MDFRQEYERLKDAFRKRDQRKQNIHIATIIDANPHGTYGFVIAQLEDGTVINVQAWTSDKLEIGYKIFVTPISTQQWNWYVLIGVNKSEDLETVTFIPPDAVEMAAHELDGDFHTGNLPWSRISTSATKVVLSSQTSGNLPMTRVIPSINEIFTSTDEIAPGADFDLLLDISSVAYIRKLEIFGGVAATIVVTETNGGNVEYATSTVATPFFDQGGWMHYNSDGVRNFYLNIKNDGPDPSDFGVSIQAIELGI